MISDEELADLPADPELAFVAFEKLLRERLQNYEQRGLLEDYSPDPYRLEYMTKVSAAARQYGI